MAVLAVHDASETGEERGHVLARDPQTLVADRDHRFVARDLHAAPNGASGWGVLDRVVQQAVDDSNEPKLVSPDWHRLAGLLQLQFVRSWSQQAGFLICLSDRRPEIQMLQGQV